jgi:hypothetical protein
MKRNKDISKQKGLLKWLMKTILVAGLFTFSGHVSAVRPYTFEPTKTEVNEARRVSSKRTVTFIKVVDALACPILQSPLPPANFTFFLRYQENRIAAKLKDNVKEPPTDEHDGFLLYYSIERSEEFHVNRIRG